MDVAVPPSLLIAISHCLPGNCPFVVSGAYKLSPSAKSHVLCFGKLKSSAFSHRGL